MNYNNINVTSFENTLMQAKRLAPKVGLAAITGKTPNKYLKECFNVLSQNNVNLERGVISFKWNSLRNANPKIAHSIEEVLVFGASLFDAISQKQSPESLKGEFLDIKQRYAKIIKETESLANPKDENKSGIFSFFDKNKKKGPVEEEQELRLENLDQILEDAHDRSRNLLERTETDLLVERSFHKAVEWYILALEDAQKLIEEAKNDGSLKMSDEDYLELKNTLGASELTTRANMSTSDKFLKIKEDLHNKSITFLTSHENTFTVIQSHLRSWKDIKNQTEALNALNDTVKAGTALMSAASVGVEEAMPVFNDSLISEETLKGLTQSFGDYDNEISNLINGLNSEVSSFKKDGSKISHWDQWEVTKKEIVAPILTSTEILEKAKDLSSRPTLRIKEENDLNNIDVSQETESIVLEEKPVRRRKLKIVKSFEFDKTKEWRPLEKMVVSRQLKQYKDKLGIDLDVEDVQSLGWTPNQTVARLNHFLSNVSVPKNVSKAVLSEVDYNVRYGDVFNADFEKILNQQVLISNKNWDEKMIEWLSSKDDLDWAYIMQWNELVYDLLIFEQDEEQRKSVFDGTSEGDKFVKEALINRISEFANEPGLSDEELKEWGFGSLIVRYAVALDMDKEVIEKLSRLWHNPTNPIDWDEGYVCNWKEKYPELMDTQAANFLFNEIITAPSNDDFDVVDANYIEEVSNIEHVVNEKKIVNENKKRIRL